MGLKLFLHAIGQVFNHLGPALRISGLLYLIPALGSIVLMTATVAAVRDPANLMAGAVGPGFAVSLAVGVVWVVAFLWMAVAWHRYVLLDEAAGSVLPPFNGERMWAYLGRSLLVGIILFLIALLVTIPLGLVIGGIVQAAPGPVGIVLAAVPGFLVYFLVGIVGYRYSVMLPATAIGKPIGLSEAWEATRGASGPIFTLSFVSALCVVVLDLATAGVALYTPWWFGGLVQLVVSWVELIVGISIITTLYGHYVERRPLASTPVPA